MSLRIKDPGAYRLAREIAQVTGRSMTTVVRVRCASSTPGSIGAAAGRPD